MRATAEPIENNKVRVSVEVDESEFDAVLNDVVRTITRDARVPGFRPGKVPRRVLEARMGGAVALRAEALNESLPDFYARAVADTDVDPIAPPEIDITAGKESGPVAFDALVEVRPTVSIPGYAGLVVTVPSPEVEEAEIEAQITRLRETEAELEPVSRPAVDGDNVTIDLSAAAGSEDLPSREDLLYEVGSASEGPELDAELRGARAGDILSVSATRPGGVVVPLRVLVKQVQEKRLPELTDEWAAESSEASTVEELRQNLRERLSMMKKYQSGMARQQGALAALTGLVEEEVPEVLVDEELTGRLQEMERRFQAQGASVGQYLAATGQEPEAFVADLRAEAVQAVKADLALRALADAEELVVTDEELDEAIRQLAGRNEMDADELRHRIDHEGRTSAVRSEERKAKAMSWLLDHVELVDDEGAPVSPEQLELASEADSDQQEEEDPGGTGDGESDAEMTDETGPVAGSGAEVATDDGAGEEEEVRS